MPDVGLEAFFPDVTRPAHSAALRLIGRAALTGRRFARLAELVALADPTELGIMAHYYRGRDANATLSRALEQLCTRGVLEVLYDEAGVSRYGLRGWRTRHPGKHERSAMQRVRKAALAAHRQLGRPVRVVDVRAELSVQGDGKLARRVSGILSSLVQQGLFVRVGRVRGDTSNGRTLFLPADVERSADEPVPMTFVEQVRMTFEKQWSQRVAEATQQGVFPRPLRTGDVREALQTAQAVGVGREPAQRVVNAMQALAAGRDACVRRVRRATTGKALLWAPIDWNDDRLGLEEATTSDAEQLVLAVRLACMDLRRPAVSAKEVAAQFRADPGLQWRGRSRITMALSDLARPDARRRRRASLFRLGLIGGQTYYSAAGTDEELEAARRFVRAGELKTRLEEIRRSWRDDDPETSRLSGLRALRYRTRQVAFEELAIAVKRSIAACVHWAPELSALIDDLKRLAHVAAHEIGSTSSVDSRTIPYIAMSDLQIRMRPFLSPESADLVWQDVANIIRRRCDRQTAEASTRTCRTHRWNVSLLDGYWTAAAMTAGPRVITLATTARQELGKSYPPQQVLRSLAADDPMSRRLATACAAWMMHEDDVRHAVIERLSTEDDEEALWNLTWSVAMFARQELAGIGSANSSRGLARALLTVRGRSAPELWSL